MLRRCYDLILTQSIQISEDFVGERIFLLNFHFVYSTGLAGFWVYEQLLVLFEYLDLFVIELVPGHNNLQLTTTLMDLAYLGSSVGLT